MSSSCCAVGCANRYSKEDRIRLNFQLIMREGDCGYRLSNENDGSRALIHGFVVPTLSQVIHDTNSVTDL